MRVAREPVFVLSGTDPRGSPRARRRGPVWSCGCRERGESPTIPRRFTSSPACARRRLRRLKDHGVELAVTLADDVRLAGRGVLAPATPLPAPTVAGTIAYAQTDVQFAGERPYTDISTVNTDGSGRKRLTDAPAGRIIPAGPRTGARSPAPSGG